LVGPVRPLVISIATGGAHKREVELITELNGTEVICIDEGEFDINRACVRAHHLFDGGQNCRVDLECRRRCHTGEHVLSLMREDVRWYVSPTILGLHLEADGRSIAGLKLSCKLFIVEFCCSDYDVLFNVSDVPESIRSRLSGLCARVPSR
jgi:hypothetical protein